METHVAEAAGPGEKKTAIAEAKIDRAGVGEAKAAEAKAAEAKAAEAIAAEAKAAETKGAEVRGRPSGKSRLIEKRAGPDNCGEIPAPSSTSAMQVLAGSKGQGASAADPNQAHNHNVFKGQGVA